MHKNNVLSKKMGLALIFILGSLLLFQRAPLAWAAPSVQNATPTPAAEEEAAEEAEHVHTEEGHEETGTGEEADTGDAATPTLAELAARVDALQTHVETLEAQITSSQQVDLAAVASEVTTAIYLLDTAGLHDLDVRLNEEGIIDPGDSGNVARVARLLSAVEWPDALAADAQGLIDVLTQLTTSLSDDNVAEAAPLAAQIHETQHGLSHSAEKWLGDVVAAGNTHNMDSAPGQAFRVTSAVYLLDTAGLHDLDVRLNEEQDLQASDAGNVARVARLLSPVDWPAVLATDAMSMTTVLNELSAALTDDDLETAAPLATQAHEVQHNFSHAAEHWLANTGEAHGHESDTETSAETSEGDAQDHGHEESSEAESAEGDHDHTEGEGD